MIETTEPDKVLLQISMVHNDHSDWGAKTNKQYEGMLKFEYALQAVVEWAIEKANQEIEPYDDISYGEAYAAQKVYELIKDRLK